MANAPRRLLSAAARRLGLAGRGRVVIRLGSCGAGAGVQLAFIDGDHSSEGVLRDFLAVEPVLDTGGLTVLHDTFPWMGAWDGPRHPFNTLHQHSRGTYQSIDLYLAPVKYGLAILRRMG